MSVFQFAYDEGFKVGFSQGTDAPLSTENVYVTQPEASERWQAGFEDGVAQRKALSKKSKKEDK